MSELVAQAVGVVAYIILMCSYQMRKKPQILFMQVISSIAFAVHFYLLGGMSAVLCNTISVFVLVLIFYFEKKKYKKTILIIIMTPLLLAIAFLTYENLYSILPIISSLLILVSFLLNDENKIRVIGVVGNTLWLIYGIIYKSYPAMLFETLTIITTIFAIIKNKKKNNMLKNKEVIIFDLDGTLIDSVNILNEIYSTLVKNFSGKVVSANQIQNDWDEFVHTNSKKGDLSSGFLVFLNKKYNDNKEIDIKKLKKQYDDIELDYIVNKVEYKEYAKEVIYLLREKKYKLVLATISPRSTLDIYNYRNKNLNSKFKLYDFFDLVLSHDDVKEKKPNPEVYLTAVKRIGVSKNRCLIIEDSLEGVKAANSAGIEVLNIVDKNMFDTQKQIDKLSTYKMDSLKEFYKTLKNSGSVAR